ncbi:MAG TPA: diguanylate cyclase [Bacteroidota bacterium]|nr:diguanylate cyclase [Bacteroidota bacterium]
MTDARVLNTVRSWVNRLTLTQELIVLAGVIVFLGGLFITAPLWKFVALAAGVMALAYVVVTIRLKSLPDLESEDSLETVPPEEQESDMDDNERDAAEQDELRGRAYHEPDSPAVPSFPEVPSVPMPRMEYEFKLSDFVDVQDDVLLKDMGPKSEFSYLARKVLTVIKEATFGHTVALFWVNREKHQLVLDSYVTESQRFTTHRRREIGTDLISQVALTGHPRIINDVNTSSQFEMIGYYEGTEPVRSFTAVPVFYPRDTVKTEDPVAVLVVDCLSEDSFGPETMTLLGDYAKMISALIRSYTGKYDLLIDSEILRSITRMREQMKLDFSLHSIVRSLAEESSRLVAWDYITVILYDESRKNWEVQFVLNRMNDSYVTVGQEIDPHGSLVGTVVQSGIAKIADSLKGMNLPRFYKAERVDTAGALMVLPINSLNRCYGALVVESKDAKSFTESDVKTLQKLVISASWGLEVLNLTDVVNNFVLVDETTGVATRKYFMERVHEEVQRSNDFENDVTLVMISIDGINEHLSRYGKEGFDFVLQNVGRMTKSSIRPYDLVGRVDFNRFAVLLINTTANDAYLWAEKLRKNIASNIINIEQKSFSITVSVGVCGAADEISDLELFENAGHVLGKAIEAGGNMVRVY